jgi:hypothetical protein
MTLDLDAMNAELRAKFEEGRAKCPDVPPEVMWRAVKAAVLTGKAVEHLAEKGWAITPEVLARTFVECLKHTATT